MKKLIFILFSFTSILCFSQSLDFAEFLFNDGDYYRTITELKRMFYEKQYDDTLKVLNLIGACYYYMEEYDNALLYFERISDKYENGEKNRIITLFKLKQFDKIINTTDKNNKYVILSRLFRGDYKKIFEYNEPDIDSIIKGYFAIKKKNPFLAGLFSAIIPGTGRMYAGRKGDGIFSMFTVIMPAGAAYYYYRIDNKTGLYIAMSLTGILYISDIYGAIVNANQCFPAYKDVYYEKILDNYSNSLFSLYFSF